MIGLIRVRSILLILLLSVTITASAHNDFSYTNVVSEAPVVVSPNARIVADDSTWNYPTLNITIEAPKIMSVSHFYTPAARANLNVVYSAGLSQVGTPYVHGGHFPGGFDCSGFVSWSYAQAGVSLPFTVSGIRRHGTVISASNARPGDILYWPGHVALYAGSNLRLDANRPGSTVQIRNIFDDPIYLRIS